jgi:hypothetical protein
MQFRRLLSTPKGHRAPRLMPILRALAHCAGDRTGNVALSFAVAAPLVLGGAGVAIDLTIWRTEQEKLQELADAAALAGAEAYNVAPGVTGARIIVPSLPAKAHVRAVRPDLQPIVVAAEEGRSVSVTLKDSGLVGFAGLFGINKVEIEARSTAVADRQPGRTCLLALEPASTGIAFSGQGTIKLHDCGIWSNASGPRSLTASGQVSVEADVACSAGGSMAQPTASLPATRRADCAAVEDPLARWAAPAQTACTYTNFNAGGAGGNVSLLPGTYCGGLQVATRGSISLAPGTYVIRGGPLKLVAEGTISGNGVGFHLAGRATAEIAAQQDVRLAAPGNRPLAGLILAGDRAPTPSGLTSRLSAGGVLALSGTVYLPNQGFALSGHGSAAEEGVLQVVAGSIDVATQGQLDFAADFAAAGFRPVTPLLPMVRLLR